LLRNIQLSRGTTVRREAVSGKRQADARKAALFSAH
jgi:hypothetical protein